MINAPNWSTGDQIEALIMRSRALTHRIELPPGQVRVDEANPGLAALTSASVAEAIEVAGAAFVSYLGLTEDDPMTAICGAALAGVITSYLHEVLRGAPAADLHARVMVFLRTILGAARG